MWNICGVKTRTCTTLETLIKLKSLNTLSALDSFVNTLKSCE